MSILIGEENISQIKIGGVRVNKVYLNQNEVFTSDRYFTYFDKITNTHILLNNSTRLAGNFTISFDAYLEQYDNTASVVLATDEGVNNAIFFNDIGFLRVCDENAVTLNITNSEIPLNKWTNYVIEKVNSILYVYKNGSLVFSSGGFGAFAFDRVGVRQDSSFTFNGFLSNIQVWEGSTKILNLPIDQYYDEYHPVVYNKELEYGNILNNISELIWTGQEPDFSIKSLNYQAEVGHSYLFEFKIETVAGEVKVDTIDTDSAWINESGTYNFLTDNTSGIHFLAFQSRAGLNRFQGRVFDIKVYDVTEEILGKFINISNKDSEFYTYSNEFNGWLGQEAVTQEVWEGVPFSYTDQYWTYNAVDNTWNLDTDGSLAILRHVNPDLLRNALLLGLDVESISGRIQPITTGPNPYQVTTAGIYYGIAYQSESLIGVKRSVNGEPSTAKLNHVSIRNFLEDN